MTEEGQLERDRFLEEDPSLTRNKRWRMIDAALRNDGLSGISSKMEIGQHDLYLKTAWWRGRIVHIDITLSRGRDAADDLPKSAQQASLETTRFDLARSWVESSCRMASAMLQTGEVGIEDIIEEWKGVAGYPRGYCPQLPAINPDTGDTGPTFQSGPLHAAAMLLMRNLARWTEAMRGK